MKKFLALVLALVMTMSLVTIAGAEGYTDADDMNYADAVEVMSAVGVVGGYADGSFNPQAGLTRGAAAKIICNMILGPTTADALVADTAPYSDVAVDNVFAGYIAYCAKEGIISGYADGTFRPAAPLTGYAFMKMLLGALGYDAATEGYTGANWSINVAKRALNIGLDNGLVDTFSGTKALTREEACLYAFNALQTAMVEYENNTSITVGDVVISTTAAAKEVAEGKVKIWDNDTMEFAEKYFTKLEAATSTEDAYGRPATEWTYDDESVGVFADEATLTYTGAEFDADLVEELEEDYDFAGADVWYNGAKGVLDVEDLNCNGYAIELFINDEDEVTDIVVIEAYAAEITDVVVDDDDKVEAVEVTVYEAGYFITNESYETIVVDVEDDEDAYALIADYEEEDVFMVVLTPGWEEADADDALLAVADVESVEGTVTTAKIATYYEGWIKVDGVKYEFANEYSQATVAVDSEGTFYLYNGYVVHFDGTTDEDAAYALILRTGSSEDKWGTDTYYAELLLTDGTTVEVEYDAEESVMNTFIVEYTEEDGVYTLTDADADIFNNVTITKGKTAIKSGDTKVATANGATVFVVAEFEDGEFDSAKVYNGYKNVKSIEATTIVVVEDYIFAIYGEDVAADTDDLIYVADMIEGPIVDTDLGTYYTYAALVEGEVVEIMADDVIAEGLYDFAKVSEEGIYDVASMTEYTDYTSGASFKKAEDEVITIGTEEYAYASDVVLYVVDGDSIVKGSINKNYTTDVASVLFTQNDDDEVDMIFVVKA